MSGERAYIHAVGMCTPVGLNAEQTYAAVRAGIGALEESAIHNKRFQPMSMALLPDDVLPPLNSELESANGLTARQRRMLRLAQPALQECLSEFSGSGSLPLFLAGPESLPGEPPAVGEGFLDDLLVQTEAAIDRDASEVFLDGRAGGIVALRAALAALDSGQASHVLVGGVDSYLDLRLLAMLDQDDRVMADGVMDGFVPGEAAVFILLSRDERSDSQSDSKPVCVKAPGISEELGHRFSNDTYTGDGLANAVRDALAAVAGKPVSRVYSSMNGENIGAKESGVAYMRNASAFSPDVEVEHPADCVGDTGAAATPLLVALASKALASGHIQSPALVQCSSDGALRGAVCVECAGQ